MVETLICAQNWSRTNIVQFDGWGIYHEEFELFEKIFTCERIWFIFSLKFFSNYVVYINDILFQFILEFNGNTMGGVEVTSGVVGSTSRVGSSSHNNQWCDS